MQEVSKYTSVLLSADHTNPTREASYNCYGAFYSPDKKYVAYYTDHASEKYRLIIRNLDTGQFIFPNSSYNNLTNPASGSGNGSILNNATDSASIGNYAQFSPDSTKFLFYSDSRNLLNPIYGESAHIASHPACDRRWYILDLTDMTMTRASMMVNWDFGQNNPLFGDDRDEQVACWVSSEYVAFVTRSTNLHLGYPTANFSYLIYLKNANDINIIIPGNPFQARDIILLSQRWSNGHPAEWVLGFINHDLHDILYSDDTTVIWRNQSFGDSVVFDISTWTGYNSTSVAEQGEVIYFQDIYPNFFSGYPHIFGYNKSKNIIYTSFGVYSIDYQTQHTWDSSNYLYATANDSGTHIAFISFMPNPATLDGSSSVYIEEVATGDITRVSAPFNDYVDNFFGNFTPFNGLKWLSDTELCFVIKPNEGDQYSNGREITYHLKNIVSNDLSTIWKMSDVTQMTAIEGTNFVVEQSFYGDLRGNRTTYPNPTEYPDMRHHIILPDCMFDMEYYRILIPASSVYMGYLGFNQYNPYHEVNLNSNKMQIWAYGFKDTAVDLPIIEDKVACANDVLNGSVTKYNDLLVATHLDTITDTPTRSIVASTYVERTDSNRRRYIPNSFRFANFTIPNIPQSSQHHDFKVGIGIFKATPTLMEDIQELQNGGTTPINPVIGLMTKIPFEPTRYNSILRSGFVDNAYTALNGRRIDYYEVFGPTIVSGCPIPKDSGKWFYAIKIIRQTGRPFKFAFGVGEENPENYTAGFPDARPDDFPLSYKMSVWGNELGLRKSWTSGGIEINHGSPAPAINNIFGVLYDADAGTVDIYEFSGLWSFLYTIDTVTPNSKRFPIILTGGATNSTTLFTTIDLYTSVTRLGLPADVHYWL